MKKAILLLSLIGLYSCDSALQKHLDEKFPPLDRTQQQRHAYNSLGSALADMEVPTITLGTSFDEIESVIESHLKEDIVSVSVSSDEQLLDVDLRVSKQFDNTFWSTNRELHDKLGELKVDVEAILHFSVGVTTSIDVDPEKGEQLTIRLLPVFDSVKLVRFEAEETDVLRQLGVGVIGSAAEFILNRYANNVTGELNKLPIFRTSVSTLLPDPKNPTKLHQVGEGNQLQLTSNELSTPFKLGNFAVLVSSNHVSAMVELVPIDFTKTVSFSTSGNKDVVKLFQEIHETAFDMKVGGAEAWVGVTKQSIALAINAIANQSKVCADVRSDLPRENFKEKIRLPHESTISCSSDRDCRQTRDCNVGRSRDNRNCSSCLLRAPRICAFGGCSGGQCVQRGNDPFCEAAKAAQNAIYAADHAARKLDCERIKEQNRLVCEAEKATKKGLCETGKEIVKRINRTGNFASIEGRLQGQVAASFCMNDIQVSENLSKVGLNFEFGGAANIDGKLKLVPLDIVGHLTCQLPFDTNLDFKVGVPKENHRTEVKLKFESRGDALGLSFVTRPLTFPVRLAPSPVEWLVTNKEMAVSCQGLNLLKPLLIQATPFMPQLMGNLEHEMEAIEGFIPLTIPQQLAEPTGKKIRAVVTAEALILKAIR